MKRLVVAGLVAAVLCGSAALAAADSPTPAPTPGPAPFQQGIDGLMPAPPGIQQGNQPSLAERYPAFAYSPFHFDVGTFLLEGLTSPGQQPANILYSVWAGTEMLVLVVVAVLTTRLLEWTFSMEVVGGAGGALAHVVQALASQVYAPLLTVALVLVGVWLVWHMLLRQRTMLGLQGAAWAVAAMVGAGIYFAAPVQVMSGVDDLTASVSRLVLGAIGSGDPKMATRASDPSFSQGDASDAELRIFVDRYWQTFVFTPWSVAALGDVGSGQRYGEELLAEQAGQSNRFDADFQTSASQSAKDWYAGKHGAERLGIVTAALVVVAAASLLVLLLGGTVLVAQLALLLLLMVAPLFFLVGVQPGVGRRMLVRWAELVAGTLLVRVLAAAFLAVVLVLSGVVTDAAGSVSWLLAATLQVALVIAAFLYRKPFLRVFAQVATPRFSVSHVSHALPARAAHSLLEWRAVSLRRAQRQAAGGAGGAGQSAAAAAARGSAQVAGGRAAAAGAAGKGAASAAAAAAGTAAAGASGVGLALLAVEAGKLGVRWTARGVRRMQESSAHFQVSGGGAPAPPAPHFSRGYVPAGIWPWRGGGNGNQGDGRKQRPSAETPTQGTTDGSASEGRPRRSAGRTYTHPRTGEKVTVVSSKILLPGPWQRERRS